MVIILKRLLNSVYGKGTVKTQKLVIIEWGYKRSVVYCVNIETGKSKILLVDNNYLMFLDEMGLIIDELRD